MGPKKKKVAASEPPAPKTLKVISPYEEAGYHNWVMLDFKLINWKYMNFKMKFKDTDHIFTIKKVLREKHGLMDDLKVCFNSFSPANEIANEMLTLQDCGIHGVTPETFINPKGFLQIDDKSIPTVQVFYDFKPSGHEEPIMLYFKKV